MSKAYAVSEETQIMETSKQKSLDGDAKKLAAAGVNAFAHSADREALSEFLNELSEIRHKSSNWYGSVDGKGNVRTYTNDVFDRIQSDLGGVNAFTVGASVRESGNRQELCFHDSSLTKLLGSAQPEVCARTDGMILVDGQVLPTRYENGANIPVNYADSQPKPEQNH